MHLRNERRTALKAADNFARLCAEGDAARLDNASLWLDETVGGWKLAMVKIAKLHAVSAEIQEAFVSIWVMHKMLALTVGSRPILARALRVLMSSRPATHPLTLYRGTTNHERRRHLYGFSWTTEANIARQFAQNSVPHSTNTAMGLHGVVLRTRALPSAILMIREAEGYSDEGEVVVDPYRLSKVELIERIRSLEDPASPPR
jgi:hypothetical protein